MKKLLAVLAVCIGSVAQANEARIGVDEVVAQYEDCWRHGLSRVDADAERYLETPSYGIFEQVAHAQAATQACLAKSVVPVTDALAGQPDRRRALRYHYTKIVSLLQLRLPEPAFESRSQYKARIERDNMVLDALWSRVVGAAIVRSTGDERRNAICSTSTCGVVSRADAPRRGT